MTNEMDVLPFIGGIGETVLRVFPAIPNVFISEWECGTRKKAAGTFQETKQEKPNESIGVIRGGG